ncbi:unnamed protein product [Protopolystoma xenopodis]|uniref:CTCK domain-containing protein n=1 Tax=Protopolystoma xenopodis TaxID=117903 RepID=A0A3S5BTH5_9PLAT|nr:unnamed protein product [Protopolystoma xenopodis]
MVDSAAEKAGQTRGLPVVWRSPPDGQWQNKESGRSEISRYPDSRDPNHFIGRLHQPSKLQRIGDRQHNRVQAISMATGDGKGNDGIITCITERTYRPKFCNRCSPDFKCCWPVKTKTKRLRFRCNDGRVIYHFFEWISICHCVKTECPETWNVKN